MTEQTTETANLRDAMRGAVAELREALKSERLTDFAESRIRRAIIFLEHYL